MKISVDVNAKERLEALLDWIGQRAEDKAHENNAVVIADFIDKFIVFELKRMENKPELITQEIEVPEEVVSEPLQKMRDQMVKGFDDFLAGKGIPLAATSTPQSGSGNVAQTASSTATVAPPSTTTGNSSPRNGNGHAVAIKRKLDGPEKDHIRREFTKLNGEFEDKQKSCTAMLPAMGTDISVFQITGFVSYLHREIASGRFDVPDMDSYMNFLQKHRAMWGLYNSPKYQKLRAQNAVNTQPKFTSGTFPKKTV